MRQATHFSALCSRWTVDAPGKLDVAAIRANNCFDHSYWGASLMHCMLDWAGQIQWPNSLHPPDSADLGVSWMELVLSFMLYIQCYLPVHRKAPPDGHCFAWARSDTEAHAFNYSWNEIASQISSMFSQFASLCGHAVMPNHAKRARILCFIQTECRQLRFRSVTTSCLSEAGSSCENCSDGISKELSHLCLQLVASH